jgi:cytochrome c biogenesis protein CcmG, thiol:disulfide interchange protein DsbE
MGKVIKVLMNRKRLVILIGVAVVASLTGVFATGLLLASQVGNRPTVGALAPDFSMRLNPEYRGGLGESVRLSELRGRVVVINFWASWCLECRKEAPGLETMYRRYKDRGVVLLGVDYLDTEAAALAYLREYDTTYPVGIDLPQQIARTYRIAGVPETFVMDRAGIIRYVAIQRVTESELEMVVEPLLAE